MGLLARSELEKKKEVKSARKLKEEQEGQFYAENCRILQAEVQRLRQSQEQSYTEQIRRLEEQVRDLSSQLLPGREKVHLEHSERRPGESKEGKETLTEDKETEAKLSPPIQSPDPDLMITIARLEENRSMLLRTGVYTESDYLLVQLARQIEMLRSSLKTGKDVLS